MLATDVKKLKKICNSLDAEKYGKLRFVMLEIIDFEDAFDDFKVADRLNTASLTEKIPDELVAIIIKYYLRATKSEKKRIRALAYNNLGSLYYVGRAGYKDYKKAAEYYEKAAKEGDALANENLAYIYYYGLDTDVDYEKAYYYFSRAALLGRCEATYKIGDMFRYGQYVNKDENMARESYIRAEELLQKDDMSLETVSGDVYKRLGDMFYEGIGIDKDPNRAYECYQRAERGFYNQIRGGNQYVEKSLKLVYERIDELKQQIMNELPALDWAKETCFCG